MKIKVSKPGVYNRDIPEPELEVGKQYQVRSPSQVVSPSEINVILEISRDCYDIIQNELDQILITEDVPNSWNLRKFEAVVVRHENTLQRGVTVRKKQGQVTVYLIDTGLYCYVQAKYLRPLPATLFSFPACAVQV